MSQRRIGILGGRFDPVHCGHLAVARLARDHFRFDQVLFVPAGTPPHKSVCTPARHRLAMLELVVDIKDNFLLLDDETRRSGPSYTIDTIDRLQAGRPDAELHFIIGSDNIAEIPTWRRYRDIVRKVTFCVAHRPGHSLRSPAALRHARIRPFPSPEWGISSTKVREYLLRGLSCRYLVPDPVLDYICAKGLYQTH